jgi:hypothetical protein
MRDPRRKFILCWALAGAVVPLIILAISQFTYNTYPGRCGKDVAASDCPADLRAFEAEEKFDRIALPLWPTAAVGGLIEFAMMETNNGPTKLLDFFVVAISILLNAGIYAAVGLVVWSFVEVWRPPKDPTTT